MRETWIPFWGHSLTAHEATALGMADYLLGMPVLACGARLRDHPGIYPANGVALYAFGGETRLALEYHALCAFFQSTMPDQCRSIAYAVTPQVQASLWRDHPSYRGRQRGRKFRNARWYAVAVLRAPLPAAGRPT